VFKNVDADDRVAGVVGDVTDVRIGSIPLPDYNSRPAGHPSFELGHGIWMDLQADNQIPREEEFGEITYPSPNFQYPLAQIWLDLIEEPAPIIEGVIHQELVGDGDVRDLIGHFIDPG
jgi:hypothetical protein